MGWGGQCGQLGHIPTGPAEAHSPEVEGSQGLATWAQTPLAGRLHQAVGLGGLWPAGGPCAPTTARAQPPGLGTPEEEAPQDLCALLSKGGSSANLRPPGSLRPQLEVGTSGPSLWGSGPP